MVYCNIIDGKKIQQPRNNPNHIQKEIAEITAQPNWNVLIQLLMFEPRERYGITYTKSLVCYHNRIIGEKRDN